MTVNIKDKVTQKERILNHLEVWGKINPLAALNEYGCFRLAAVIFELKEAGHHIETVMKSNRGGQHYAEYKLHRRKQQTFDI